MGARKTDVVKVPDGAHYLHGRTGLEPVLRVPVADPEAIAWVPRRELLMVATTDGALIEVDPVMGTRPRNQLGGTARCLTVAADKRRYAALLDDGGWCSGLLGEDPLFSGQLEFERPLGVFILGAYVVAYGDGTEGRSVCILKDGDLKRRIPLAAGTIVFPGADGKIGYARATAPRLETGRLGSRVHFSDEASTAHDLTCNGLQVLGWTEYGAVVWGLEDGHAMSFGLLDLFSGALNRQGDWVAFGTRGGVVALVDMRTPTSRRMPFLTKAHDQAIHSVRFSTRGRWFATVGARIQLWSWEPSEVPSEK